MKAKLIPQEFGPRVRLVRKEKGITQTELSEATGISTAVLSRIEAGKVSPTLDQTVLITEALGGSISILFHETKKTEGANKAIKFTEADVDQFVSECCKKKKGAQTYTDDFFKAFRSFLEWNGLSVTDNFKPLFSKMLAIRFGIHPIQFSSGKRGYLGVTIKKGVKEIISD